MRFLNDQAPGVASAGGIRNFRIRLLAALQLDGSAPTGHADLLTELVVRECCPVPRNDPGTFPETLRASRAQNPGFLEIQKMLRLYFVSNKNKTI